MTSKVLIFGYGLFGQAMFHILERKPGLSLSVFLRTPTADRKELAQAEKVYHRACELPLEQFEIVMVTLPSYAIAESLRSVLPTGKNGPLYVSCAKGID